MPKYEKEREFIYSLIDSGALNLPVIYSGDSNTLWRTIADAAEKCLEQLEEKLDKLQNTDEQTQQEVMPSIIYECFWRNFHFYTSVNGEWFNITPSKPADKLVEAFKLYQERLAEKTVLQDSQKGENRQGNNLKLTG